MASIRARTETGLLFFDFRFNGLRCREQTLLQDTSVNRKRLEKALAKIEADMAAGTFDYAVTFPGSRNAPAKAPEPAPASPPGAPVLPVSTAAAAASAAASSTPSFKDFTATWLSEHQIEWRRSHLKVLNPSLSLFSPFPDLVGR